MATHTALTPSPRGVSFLRRTCVILALALSLAGCSSSSTTSSAADSVGEQLNIPAYSPAESEMKRGISEESMEKEQGVGVPQTAKVDVDIDRSIIKTGSARLRAEDPQEAFKRMAADVEKLGGSVASSSFNTFDSGPSAWGSLRIPAQKFDPFVADIATYGTVDEVSTSAEDVGAVMTDLEARMKALESSIARLNDLIAKAETTADLLQAESQMTNRQAELDSITAQRNWYADHVAMSTLDVTFTSPVSFKGEPGSVWQQSWDGFVSGMTVIVVALVWLLPWMILVALIATPFIIWRGRRRARIRHTLPSAPLVQEEEHVQGQSHSSSSDTDSNTGGEGAPLP